MNMTLDIHSITFQYSQTKERGEGAQCHKTIMLFSDGGTEWPEEIFKKLVVRVLLIDIQIRFIQVLDTVGQAISKTWVKFSFINLSEQNWTYLWHLYCIHDYVVLFIILFIIYIKYFFHEKGENEHVKSTFVIRYKADEDTKDVRVFTYAVGPHPIPTAVLKQMACSTGGQYSVITTRSSVRTKIQVSSFWQFCHLTFLVVKYLSVIDIFIIILMCKCI